jgi:hypothetical protein
MILNLLIMGTPGIFSSMMSIACRHRVGNNPSVSGIDIIAACTEARSTDSSSFRSMHARSCPTCLPEGEEDFFLATHPQHEMKSSFVTTGLIIFIKSGCLLSCFMIALMAWSVRDLCSSVPLQMASTIGVSPVCPNSSPSVVYPNGVSPACENCSMLRLMRSSSTCSFVSILDHEPVLAPGISTAVRLLF